MKDRSAQTAALGLGITLGATTTAGAAMLLYTGRGFLGTAGFLVGLSLAGLAAGLWAGLETAVARRRWFALTLVYAAAAIFATVWTGDEWLRSGGFGGALGAFFLLAEPAYATGAVFQTFARRDRAAGAAGFLGAAFGVLAATQFLIPKLPSSVIFGGSAAVILIIALLENRRIPRSMETPGISLAGRKALVTGVGERGQLGYAIAQRLRQSGAQVCITGLHENVAELANEIGAVSVQCDLTLEDDVVRLITTATDRMGGIDILVNVAGGLSVIKPLAETTRAEWERETQRNAETAFLVSRAALPSLRKGGGAIINFASPAGTRAVAQLGAYSAAKAAVIALTRALAIEEKASGVRVNAIAPGMIDTEQNRSSAADPSSVKWVTRDQVADVVLFLASNAASGISGETIQVLGEGVE